MRNTAAMAAAILIAATATASAQQKADTTKVDADIVAAFPTAPADWKARLDQDETMKECSLGVRPGCPARREANGTRAGSSGT